MATSSNTYTVKSGDCLWNICSSKTYASKIAGSDTWAKVKTLAKLNNIKAPEYIIHTGQVLKLSESGSSGGTTTSTPQQVSDISFGIPQIYHEDTGIVTDERRSVFVKWSWKRENTASFSVHWNEYIGSTIVKTHDDTISIPEDTKTSDYHEYCFHTLSAQETTTKIRFKILPVAKTRKDNDKNEPYWKEGTGSDDVKWSATKEYDFSNNPPKVPSVPTLEIDDRTLTIKIDDIDPTELDAKYVVFNVIKNNEASVYTSPKITIDTTYHNYVSHEWSNAEYGAIYTARARCVSAKNKESGWTAFSAEVRTKPSAPAKISKLTRKKRSDGSISAYLEWDEVKTATKYKIEYVTIKSDFEDAPNNIQSVETAEAVTRLEITGITAGIEYFFRVSAIDDKVQNDNVSEPSPIASLAVGSKPSAPTTWSSAQSAFVGESMELNWLHNSTDGSEQTTAQVRLLIGDNIAPIYSGTFTNDTTDDSGEQKVEKDLIIMGVTYGKIVSYKGQLHIKLDTACAQLINKKVEWAVQTAGITGEFGDWSNPRTIYIYEKPVLALSVTSDLAGSTAVQTLTSFPFYVRATNNLTSYEIQRPIGYHIQILSHEFYETVDDTGHSKIINPGDAVYSGYFDTEDLGVIMFSAGNIDLESGVRYTVYCVAAMSTGLSIEQTYEFDVEWDDVQYNLSAEISIDESTYAASIIPYCTDENGDLVDDVAISIYRRAYDGGLVEIASDVPNNTTAVTDPHPALDYARYRLVAKDTTTGAISFYDLPGHHIGCKAAVIQWDEEWTTFDLAEQNAVEGPAWSGSILVLPYNITVTDSRNRESSLVSYIGREYPVAYYGTMISEASQWSVEIPKNDLETIYALRRLSRWPGAVYVRESSGMGYWASVETSFNIAYNSITIPVTFTITRVEGGV